MPELNRGIRESIRQAASRLRNDFRFVGEISCPNCDSQAWQIEVPGKGVVTICPECGFGLAES